MSGLILPPEYGPKPVTRPWGGEYVVDAAETAVGQPGRVTAEEAAQRRVRESARKAGHRPVGAVTLTWAEPDDGRVTLRASVQVVPNGETVTLDPAAVAARLAALDNGR